MRTTDDTPPIQPNAIAQTPRTPTSTRRERAWHDLFLVSVWIKGIVGLLQVVGGGLLLVVSQDQLIRLAMRFTQPELIEDPHDSIGMFLRHSAEQFGHGTKLFASIYLAVHGLIKVLLVAGLLRRKMWSYPASMWVLAAFVVYQCYRYTQTHSPWLIALTVLDIAVIVLVWHEWRTRQRLGFTTMRRTR
ncbi:MAG: DUF2127 domain-containing protein [Luteimonas sp.]